MILEIDRVSKRFDNSDKEAVNNVSLTINEGEFICLVGPSGCGKSTLLNMIAGLERPTAGEIRLAGEKITGPGADRVVMFQDAALFPWLNVLDNVTFGLRLMKKDKVECNRIAMNYLKMVKLTKFAHYRVHELSGGMKQRVALARALAMDSAILLMDEPFSALDKQTINKLRDEVAQIWEETRKTIVMVTHSVEEALFFGDRVVVMSAHPGEIREILTIDLPRPRPIDSASFVSYRKTILEEVRKEVDRSEQAEFGGQ
ncbi:MAG: ABC transporter ATP-binding protein [Lachnospiraceae bacterium]|jgi:NitT/TauT family transport system ATP-binding protein|nr:ABC transporter ATP-binding protein [Lachnospiraceae bacterium]